MEKIFQCTDEKALELWAQALAPQLIQGDVLFLNGPLGVGKSTFARALIRSLAKDPNLTVPSPTFTLVQTYHTKPYPLWHFDLYRLKDPMELFELGYEEALALGILVIEWPEKAATLGLAPTLVLNFQEQSDGSRHITFITQRDINMGESIHAD